MSSFTSAPRVTRKNFEASPKVQEIAPRTACPIPPKMLLRIPAVISGACGEAAYAGAATTSSPANPIPSPPTPRETRRMADGIRPIDVELRQQGGRSDQDDQDPGDHLKEPVRCGPAAGDQQAGQDDDDQAEA
jgi:hypothetical protein